MDRQREQEWAQRKAEPKPVAKGKPKKQTERKGMAQETSGEVVGKAEESAALSPLSSVRARERVSDAVLLDWTARIKAGESDHGAAALSREALGHVFSCEQLRYACQTRPEFAGMLDSAKETLLRPLRATVRAIAEGRIKDDKVARVQFQAATWLLAKHRPLEYGEHARVEHTGKDGAPIRTEVVMVLADARALARSENPE